MSATMKALIALLGSAILMVVLLLAYGFYLNQPGGELDQREGCAKWRYTACKALHQLHAQQLADPNYFSQFDAEEYAKVIDEMGCKQ